MSAPSPIPAIRPGFTYRLIQALSGLLAVAFLIGGFEGVINGDYLYPFGFVLAATFALVLIALKFTVGTDNIHVVQPAEAPES